MSAKSAPSAKSRPRAQRSPVSGSPRASDSELAEVAKTLYGYPLRHFIEHRTAAARALDRPLAASVRALRKPSPAAWLVDQLARHDLSNIDAAIALGVELQQAQTDGDGERIRELSRQHRDEVRRLTDRARAISASSELTASPAVLDEVAQTVSAAMADAGAAAAVRSGLLVRSLRSTGFEPVDVTDAIAVPGMVVEPTEVPAVRSETRGTSQRSATENIVKENTAAETRAAEKRARLAEERRRRELDRQRGRLEEQRDRAESDADRLVRELDALELARQEKSAALSDARNRIADLNGQLDALQ